MAGPALHEPGGIRSDFHCLFRPAAAIARRLGDDFGKSGPSAKRLARRLSLVAFRRGPACGSDWASRDFFLDERLRLRIRGSFCSVRFRILVGFRFALSRRRGIRRVLHSRAYDNRSTLRSCATRHGNGLVSRGRIFRLRGVDVCVQRDCAMDRLACRTVPRGGRDSRWRTAWLDRASVQS